MSLADVLAPLPGMAVERVIIGNETVTLLAHPTAEAHPCPGCGKQAIRIHSRSRRTLLDLSVCGRQVRLSLQVRRFFCEDGSCPRTTFTEQLPDLAAPRARKTCRLQEALCQIGFALGAEAGARLAKRLGMPCSPDTLLRLICQSALPTAPTPRVLGVDDFSFQKGRTFGTILLDLERHAPIDLLPDREAPTLASWLEVHPGIEIVSRDRGRPFRDAISQAAPTALQVTDRWHLLKNLGEALEAFWLHKKQLLKAAAPEAELLPRPPPLPIGARAKAAEEASASWHSRKIERYHHIHERFAVGVDRGTIAVQLGISAYPNKPAARNAIKPQAKWRNAR
ncbi:MAG TPA: ISL3 family transposase [Ktedonobacterales bacterium]|nr:ISL3 family transposase [Ktedonobacterales bacterium]